MKVVQVLFNKATVLSGIHFIYYTFILLIVRCAERRHKQIEYELKWYHNADMHTCSQRCTTSINFNVATYF